MSSLSVYVKNYGNETVISLDLCSAPDKNGMSTIEEVISVVGTHVCDADYSRKRECTVEDEALAAAVEMVLEKHGAEILELYKKKLVEYKENE